MPSAVKKGALDSLCGDTRELVSAATSILLAHRVHHATLFGSQARGTADKRSDLDIAFWPDEGFSAADLFAIEDALEELPTLRSWDLVDMSLVGKNETLCGEVSKYGIVLC